MATRSIVFMIVMVHICTFSAGILAENEMVGFPAPWSSPYRVDSHYPHHLVNQENQHLFILNKTAWAYFGCNDPQGVLDRAKAQGVNVLRVALEGEPYSDVLDIEMWPWGGTRQKPDWNTWNESYWQEVEERIRLAGNQGIGFDLVLYLNIRPKAKDIDNQKSYWKQTIHRLSKYPNILTWEIMNEHISNEEFQDAAGLFFQENDPFCRPVCSSDGTTDDAIWPHKVWMDLAIVHTCTGSTPDYDLNDWYLSVARNTRSHGKPAFNNESGREKRHRNDDGVHRRKQGWLWCTAGGYWTWHSWDGCEGIDEADYKAPGAEFMRPLADFFRSIPFWKLDPNYTACVVDHPGTVSTTLSEPGRNLIISYCCTKETGETVQNATASVRLPNGNYTVLFKSPVTLETLHTTILESDGLHRAWDLSLPNFQDDILICIERSDSRDRTLIPGTH